MSWYLPGRRRKAVRNFFWGKPENRILTCGAMLIALIFGAAYGGVLYSRTQDPLLRSTHVLVKDGPKLSADGVPACDLLNAAQAKVLTGTSLVVTQVPGVRYFDYSYSRCDFTVGKFGGGDTPKLELTTQVEPDNSAPAYAKTITNTTATPNQAAMSVSAADLSQLKGASKAEYIYNGDTNDAGLMVTTPYRLTFTVWTTKADENLLIPVAHQVLFNLK